MSEAQAAGEIVLDEGHISLAISDADMESLPADGVSEADVQSWLRKYARRASSAPFESESLAETDARAAA